jgi:NADPH:quinone reductase-like Zn-dependent oxidoreductase
VDAIRQHSYGAPDVLVLEEVERPVLGDHDVLVHVRAASVNALDAHNMRGLPYLVRMQAGPVRPRPYGLGADLAGVVQAVGGRVMRFAPGDEVFGGRGTKLGAGSAGFAEYARFPEDGMLHAKPAGLTFEQAAAVPVAGWTALQAVRDKGQVQPGQTVLVNGAAGGVGTFAVQIAKAFGAEVTGICSTRNVELVQSLGADHVVDYTREDFTAAERTYDVVIDAVANRTLAETRRAVAPGGVLVGVGAPPDMGRWIGPLRRPLAMAFRSAVGKQRLVPFLAKERPEDLAALRELVEDGKVKPVIDRTYPLSEVAEAFRYFEQGHTRGKIVITA